MVFITMRLTGDLHQKLFFQFSSSVYLLYVVYNSLVQVKCQCGSSSPVPRRCSAQIWMCSNKCGKLLNCGKHYCADLCHPGDCGQCKLTAVEKCECGAKERLTLCSSVQWKCETVCGKLFDCGQHTCKATCHVSSPDGCGQCPNSGNRQGSPTCSHWCNSIKRWFLFCQSVANAIFEHKNESNSILPRYLICTETVEKRFIFKW